jgi:D-serine deaminase-like pyridoxal phosphate-dependent protein
MGTSFTSDATWASGTSLRTPFVAVHRQRLQANIDRIAALARRQQVSVRPHAKTLKCPEIARLQIDAGAVGITVAKPEEARVFLRAGVPSVTLAYPVIDAGVLAQLLDEAGAASASIQFVIDSTAGLDALQRATAGRKECTAAFVELDVGLHRCGVPPQSGLLVELAAALARGPGARLAGILSHAGHAYGAGTAEGVAAVAASELAIMNAAAAMLRAADIEVPCISVGSTPTVCLGRDFTGVDEIRPGNYVFFDRTAMRLGAATESEIALAVFATVVSVNATYCIVDAGSKSLSSDVGPHGTGGDMGYGDAHAFGPHAGRTLRVAKLSEEHGFIPHEGQPLEIGTRLLIVPNHSCPVANLADEYVVLSAEAQPQSWSVAARGRTR